MNNKNNSASYDAEDFLNQHREFIEKYEELNPEWAKIALGRLIHHCANNLRIYIDDPKEKVISWGHPYLQLQLPVDVEEKDDGVWPSHFRIRKDDVESEEPTTLTETLRRILNILAIRNLTNDTALLKQEPGDTEGEIVSPRNVVERLEILSDEDQQKEIDRLYDIRPAVFTFEGDIKDEETGEPKHVKTIFTIQFHPLIIDQPEKRAYYPLAVGLEFEGYQPTEWSDKAKKGFWDVFFWQLKKSIPEERFEAKIEPEAVERVEVSKVGEIKATLHAEISRTTVAAEPALHHIRSALHLEKMKFPDVPAPYQPHFLDLLSSSRKAEVEEHSIEAIGIDLSLSEKKAVFSIQRLLEETNYKGNLPAMSFPNNPFNFSGDVVSLRFTLPQYLEAYGVSKYRTAREKEEYSGAEREQAIQALYNLSVKRFLFVYKRKYWENGKEKVDRVEAVDSMIKILRDWRGLTTEEDSQLDRGQETPSTNAKLTIEIRPSIIFVDQITSYFVLKPANYLEEIKIILGSRASNHVYTLVDFLQAEVALRYNRSRGKGVTNWLIKYNYKTWATKLRMDKYLKKRQHKRVREMLNKTYEALKELGYLLKYETTHGKTKELDVLTMNPQKYRLPKRIENGKESEDDPGK